MASSQATKLRWEEQLLEWKIESHLLPLSPLAVVVAPSGVDSAVAVAKPDHDDLLRSPGQEFPPRQPFPWLKCLN